MQNCLTLPVKTSSQLHAAAQRRNQPSSLLLSCAPSTQVASFSGRIAAAGFPTRRRHPVQRHSVSPGTEEQRSPADAPQEWETPAPSKRPDIFPEFEKMERVFLPKPLPGDPEMPDEEMEEAKKRTFPGDPDPEQKPGEPAEPDQPEEEEGVEGEPEKSSDTPTIPE